MRREIWRLMIASKRFYVNTFRLAERILALSLVLNLLLVLGVCYAYFNLPERAYYATNGEVPPTVLTAMDAPNKTSVPLLANDLVSDDEEKVIPN